VRPADQSARGVLTLRGEEIDARDTEPVVGKGLFISARH
jgi:hypothetical protein